MKKIHLLLFCLLLSLFYHFAIGNNDSSLINHNLYDFAPNQHIILNTLISILPVLVIPSAEQSVSSAIWVFYFFTYLGTSVIAPYVLSEAASINLCLFLTLCMLITYWTSRVRITSLISKIQPLKLPAPPIVLNIFAVTIIVGLAALVATSNFDFTGYVYTRRYEMREFEGQFRAYFSMSLAIVTPLLFLYLYFIKKSFISLLFAGSYAIIDFGVYGSKQSVFILIMTIVLFAFAQKRLILHSLVGMFSLLLLIYFLFPSYSGNNPFSLHSLILAILERVFVSPGLVASVTWDFLSSNTSISSLSYSVGAAYFTEGTNASSNMYLNELPNLFPFGGILVSFTAGLLLSLLKDIPGKQYFPLPIVSSFVVMSIWSEQKLSTSLLSSGVFFLYFLFFILYLFSRRRIKNA